MMIDDIKNYYDSNAEYEWNRLSNPYSIIEYKSTLHLIDKYFPKKGDVLDAGSGPGRYSLELLKKGYRVSLLDISRNELDIAKRKIEAAELKAEGYYCKSALELDSFESEAFDGVLVMGPLYHLHNEEDRLKVLKDAYRILKKNGTALISYINTWGCLRAAVTEFPQCFLDMQHFGRYINGNLKFSPEESFTETFFTSPPLALEEVRKAGFNVVSYAGAESFLSGLRLPMNNLSTYMPEEYENFLKAAIDYCELPQYRDATEHLHIIVKK